MSNNLNKNNDDNLQKIQWNLNKELAAQAIKSSTGSSFLYLILFSFCDLFVNGNSLTHITGLTILLTNTLRLIHAKRFPKDENQNTDLWKKIYAVQVITNSMAWTIFSSWILVNFGFENIKSHVVLLVVSGLGASSMISLGAYPLLLLCYLGILIIGPILITFIVSYMHLSMIYPVLFTTYFIYLAAQVNSYFKLLVDNLLNQKKLIVERDLLQTVLEVVPGEISFFDNNHNLIFSNQIYKNIIKNNSQQNDIELFSSSEKHYLDLLNNFIQSDSQNIQTKIEIVRNNELRWHLICLNKTYKNNAVALIAMDIHKEKILEDEMLNQKQNSEFALRMAMLGEMANGMAHEINNPLAIIKGKFELLKNLISTNIEPEKLIKYNQEVCKIDNNIKRITKIIKALQEFSKNSEDEKFENMKIISLVEQALYLCTERLNNNNIEIKIVIDHELSITCRTSQIIQVFLNLINNSYDAIDKLKNKWILFKTQIVDKKIQIRIEDSGSGIPPQIVSKMMQPFFTTKEIGKGTGLGLSSARGIIEANKGRLFYDQNSVNTCFVLEFDR